MKLPLSFLSVAFLLFHSGCKKPEPPRVTTTDRFGRTAQLSDIPEALTKKEVFFHVRMKLPASELQAQLTKRGLAEALDPKDREELVTMGAPKELLDLLSSPAVVLTKEECALYAQRVEARKGRTTRAKAEEEARRQSRNANLNSTVNSLNNDQLSNEVKRLQEKRDKLMADRIKTKFSSKLNTPYQRLTSEIADVDKEIASIYERIRQRSRGR